MAAPAYAVLRLLAGIAAAGLLAVLATAGAGTPAGSLPASVAAGEPTVRLLLPHQIDEDSVPGCLRIIGRPAPASCLPCPPLWLGGPGIRCVVRAPVQQRPACAQLARLPAQTVDSQLFRRFCAPSAGE